MADFFPIRNVFSFSPRNAWVVSNTESSVPPSLALYLSFIATSHPVTSRNSRLSFIQDSCHFSISHFRLQPPPQLGTTFTRTLEVILSTSFSVHRVFCTHPFFFFFFYSLTFSLDVFFLLLFQFSLFFIFLFFFHLSRLFQFCIWPTYSKIIIRKAYLLFCTRWLFLPVRLESFQPRTSGSNPRIFPSVLLSWP